MKHFETVEIRFDALFALLGRPQTTGDGKETDIGWLIYDKGGNMVLIENFRDGYAYCGPGGLHPSDISAWKISSNSSAAISGVKRVIGIGILRS